MRSFRLSLVAPLLVASTLLLTGTTATAEPTTTTSTVTTETTSTTSTTAPITTTAVPATTPTPSSTPPAPPRAARGGDEPVDGPIVLPPDLQAKMNAVHRTRPNDDTKLLEVVTAYATSAHIPPEQAMVLGPGPFPVAGLAHHPHGGAAVDPKPILDRWVDEAIVYAFALATNPTATTAPEPVVAAPEPVSPPRTATAPRRTARAASIGSRGNAAGQIFVIGSLLALCGGRVIRRTRAKLARAPDDE